MEGDVLYPVGPDCIPVTLTPKGFIELYETDRIFQDELDPSLIIDKAKVDGLAKVIVCLQAPVSQPYHVAEEICANTISGLYSKALGDSRTPSRPRVWSCIPLCMSFALFLCTAFGGANRWTSKFPLFLNIQHPTGLRRPRVTSEQHDGTSSVASDGPVGEHATPNRSNKPSRRAKQLTLEPEETPGFRPEVKLQSTESRGTVPEY